MATKKQTGQFCDVGAEEKLDIIFNNATDGIFIHDDKCNIVDVNQTACDSLGYTKEDLLSVGMRKIQSPEVATQILGLVKKIIKNGQLIFESTYIRKDGTLMPVEINARTIKYSGKSAILCFVRDIAERKKIEEGVQKTNEQLLEAQKLSQIGSYDLDVTSGIWESSPVLNELFGIEDNYQKDIEGWTNIVHPDDREAMLNYLKSDVLKKRKPFDRAYRIVRVSDSEVRWVHGLGHFRFDPKGKIVAMVGTIQDITTTKVDEEELEKERIATEESESKYRGLIENTPMCVKVFDKDGNLIFLNKGGREEHGIKEGDDLLKWDWLGTVKPQYIPAAKKVFEQAFKGQTGEVEFEHTIESAAHPWCHGLISPILDEKGKVASVLFYSTNITELKRNEIKAKENELMFKTLLNSLPLCIKWFDSKGGLISINRGGREEHFLTEKTEDEIKNWDYMSSIEDKYKKSVKNCLANAIKGIPSSLEMEHVPGTSLGQWCFSEFTPVLDNENKVKYILFISHDITQTKMRTEELKQHAKDTEKINQLMINRENKMVELKEKIKELEIRTQINNENN